MSNIHRTLRADIDGAANMLAMAALSSKEPNIASLKSLIIYGKKHGMSRHYLNSMQQFIDLKEAEPKIKKVHISKRRRIITINRED